MVDPHEEISVKDSLWTCLHYAAHFQADELLELLIKISYKRYPDNFLNIINIQTKEGWSPAMIAVIYKSSKCFELLLNYGGINMKLKDKKNRGLIDLANQYQSNDCKFMIKNQQNKIYANGFLPLNLAILNNSEDYYDMIKDEKKRKLLSKKQTDLSDVYVQQYKDLLVLGQRLPCLICLSNDGYIKYTECCGQPMHYLCKSEKIQKCPFCSYSNFKLISEVLFPERAFTMPGDSLQEKLIDSN